MQHQHSIDAVTSTFSVNKPEHALDAVLVLPAQFSLYINTMLLLGSILVRKKREMIRTHLLSLPMNCGLGVVWLILSLVLYLWN